MSEQEKNLRWYNLAMMAFVAVWGFGNVVNNFANQGLTVVVSWVLIIGLYFDNIWTIWFFSRGRY